MPSSTSPGFLHYRPVLIFLPLSNVMPQEKGMPPHMVFMGKKAVR